MKPIFAGEFHARSAFSFLRGANTPDELVIRALELGYDCLAITDHNGFYGSARANKRRDFLKEDGAGVIRANVGATWEMADGSHLPVLCMDRDGYQSLSRGFTHMHLDGGFVIESGVSGLIALTGDREGPVCRHLLRDNRAAALHEAEKLVALFGRDNVYVEINRHELRDDRRLNRQLVDLAEHLKLRLLACNAPLHVFKTDRLLSDAFACLRNHVTLDEAGHLLAVNGERHLKSPAEMDALFADLPEALENTRHLRDRLEFTLEDLGYRFPDFPDERGQPMSMADQTRRLRELAEAEFNRISPRHTMNGWNQIAKEVDVIHRLGFSGYFLTVHDIVHFAKSQGIFCQGRGSAANSVVCYTLGITAVDPIKNGLLFDRFLVEDQVAWPDVDIDFPSGEKRESVIQYVFQKYGARGAAMTANVISYRSRSAFREMSKVLGFSESIADRFSNEGSSSWKHSPKTAKEKQEDFEQRTSTFLPPSHPRFGALSKLFNAVLGKPRHLGQHSGGIIVCAGRLDSVVPIQRATMPGRAVVQWDKDDCEDLGIVKIDLLGLGTLAAMEDIIEICGKRGVPEVLGGMDLEEPEVFAMMQRADTIGTFQVESRAQMASLPLFKPNSYYDVAMQVAIIRPGPIVGDLVHPLIARRQGKEKIDYIHEDCQDILERTYGVALFQEQVLLMARKMAGFDSRQADKLRRAIAFTRDDERMKRIEAELREGMTRNGHDEEVQEKMAEAISKFALYGFPESHALSFAYLAYASCWLKLHHPAAFYTGLINNQPMGFYSVHTLMQDAKHRGIRFLPVSVVHSGVMTDVVDEKTIRLGLHRVKGLSADTMKRLVDERGKHAFESLEDFLEHARPKDKERRALAKAGALNDLPQVVHRRHALWQSELPIREELLRHENTAPVLPPMAMAERLSADLETQGASTGPHPMKLWRQTNTLRLQRARDLDCQPHGMPVTVGGMVICRQRPGTAKGHCFISLEDETGIANLFVPESTYKLFRLVIVTEGYLLAEGRVQRRGDSLPTVYVTSIRSLPGFDPTHGTSSHDFH
ncbi:error-prone DNA polymerase [Luteolibacter ambystomatis]|uniref:Error-prone DNA polymerase n=1 Tax=Luteolibacter ambystomatis TaxID=2824561 RepID=A0A975J0P3_9BACT|nr:error-prone DNA polymerase [Luteolibacter ambystomatis]QUE51873.1 error-prone DNA polymerase [Luteolibacter ambystomatis]